MLVLISYFLVSRVVEIDSNSLRPDFKNDSEWYSNSCSPAASHKLPLDHSIDKDSISIIPQTPITPRSKANELDIGQTTKFIFFGNNIRSPIGTEIIDKSSFLSFAPGKSERKISIPCGKPSLLDDH